MNGLLFSVRRETVVQATVAMVLAFPALVSAQGNLEQLPLLQAADLEYEGAFRVPSGGVERETFNYGGKALAYNAASNSLFMTGHDHHNRTAEITIPAIVNSNNLDDLQRASFVQEFVDATEGKRTQINPSDPNSKIIGGNLVYGNRLIMTAFSYYDGAGTQSGSHFARPLDLSSAGSVIGPVASEDRVHYTSAYMTHVPTEWQSAFGGPALTGNCCRAIIGYHSNGPALFVFDPDDVGSVNPVPTAPLVYYNSQNPLGPGVSSQNNTYNLTSRVEGVVFPRGTRSVLFFGRHGTGPYCYGIGEACNDPANADQGNHAYPYRYQVWAYDALDLLAVKDGRRAPYSVQPYAIWTYNMPFETDDIHNIGGATYDPSTDRIFLSRPRGEAKLPIIQVLRVNIGPRPEAPSDLNTD